MRFKVKDGILQSSIEGERMNTKNYDQKQSLVFPPRIRRFLPDDHPAVIINDIVDNMDLSILFKKLSSEGNPSYHPAMMLKVLIYAYATGIFSSRKIQRALQESVAFIYLAAWQKPDFRTISDFRKNNLCELKVIFSQVVDYCNRMQMISLGHIAIDGSKLRANAADRHTWTKKRIDHQIERLLEKASRADTAEDSVLGDDKSGSEVPEHIRKQRDRIQRLKQIRKQLDESEKSSLNETDPDAAFMKTSHGVRTSFNAQIAVDDQNQIIVAADVISDPSDVEHLLPMVEQVEANIGKPEKLSADSGYCSGENLRDINHKGIDAFIPDPEFQGNQRRPTKEEFFHRSRFTRDEAQDCFICPAGQKLPFSHLQKRKKKEPLRMYRCRDSAGCPLRDQCTRNRMGRTIALYPYFKELNAMREKLKTGLGKRTYRRRQVIVEPVFATLKRAMGFTGFLLRGLQKVRGEFMLACIAHNVRKLANYLIKHRLSPQAA